MAGIFRFILGIAIGSFLNVIALRYDPDKFLLGQKIIGGRSHCPHCRKTLRWFELVPLFSYLVQRGRCRNCTAVLSPQYPLAEIASGLIFLLIPYGLSGAAFLGNAGIYIEAIWIAVFSLLLLMSLIDMRLQMIPDEIIVGLLALGSGLLLLSSKEFGISSGFLGDYALIFGLRSNIWINHLSGVLFGSAFFMILIILTKGRGMGMGDAKLATALGLIFGWPEILFIVIFSFLTGSFYGLFQILRKKERMKSAVPFGPFLALASTILFFFGNAILHGYFSLFNL